MLGCPPLAAPWPIGSFMMKPCAMPSPQAEEPLLDIRRGSALQVPGARLCFNEFLCPNRSRKLSSSDSRSPADPVRSACQGNLPSARLFRQNTDLSADRTLLLKSHIASCPNDETCRAKLLLPQVRIGHATPTRIGNCLSDRGRFFFILVASGHLGAPILFLRGWRRTSKPEAWRPVGAESCRGSLSLIPASMIRNQVAASCAETKKKPWKNQGLSTCQSRL
jgi:hypothetical protein